MTTKEGDGGSSTQGWGAENQKKNFDDIVQQGIFVLPYGGGKTQNTEGSPRSAQRKKFSACLRKKRATTLLQYKKSSFSTDQKEKGQQRAAGNKKGWWPDGKNAKGLEGGGGRHRKREKKLENPDHKKHIACGVTTRYQRESMRRQTVKRETVRFINP